jgi:hypothetical protein
MICEQTLCDIVNNVRAMEAQVVALQGMEACLQSSLNAGCDEQGIGRINTGAIERKIGRVADELEDLHGALNDACEANGVEVPADSNPGVVILAGGAK